MEKKELFKIILILILPFIINFTISSIIGFTVYNIIIAEGKPREIIGIEITRTIFTYNFYWSIIQVCFGMYLIKIMGGIKWFKNQFNFEDFRRNIGRSLLLIFGLFIISSGLIWLEQFIMANITAGGWESYMAYWSEIKMGIPLWSKLYLVLIAPFTAGIFEEIIWRGYGVSMLERHMSSFKALLIQAIAFGFWHGISLHTVITAIIGFIYGYVYIKRRRLLNISIAHIITDIIGFYIAFMT